MSVATRKERAEEPEVATLSEERARGYVLIPEEVARSRDLTDGAFRTYCVLRRYCFGRRSYCWPSMKTLAAERGCSDETIRRHVHELADAGFVTVARRGRHNVYHFAGVEIEREEARATVKRKSAAGINARPTKSVEAPREEKGAVACEARRGIKPHPTEDNDENHLVSVRRVHTDEGQGFTKEGRKETTVVVHTSIDETAARLMAYGVAEGAARRLVAMYGEEMCRYAMGLLEQCQARGLRIRNPGGWLYSAVTQGFVRVAEEAATPAAATERQVDEVAKAEADHAARIKERRREALRRRGIPEDAERLWERVTARMKERGQGSRLLAAAYLRPVGEGTYCVEGAAGGIAGRLRDLLPAIAEAIGKERDGEVVVTVGQGAPPPGPPAGGAGPRTPERRKPRQDLGALPRTPLEEPAPPDLPSLRSGQALRGLTAALAVAQTSRGRDDTTRAGG